MPQEPYKYRTGQPTGPTNAMRRRPGLDHLNQFCEPGPGIIVAWARGEQFPVQTPTSENGI